MREPAEPLRLSGSQMNTLTKCALQWFAGHEAKGDRGTSAAQGFGSIVHALAAEAVRSGVEPDVAELSSHLDAVWDALGLRALDQPARACARPSRRSRGSSQWHRTNTREVLAVEHHFDVTIDVDGRATQFTGSMDRVELDDDGIHVVDFKTSKTAMKATEAEVNPQLGVYQLAVEAGATDDDGARRAERRGPSWSTCAPAPSRPRSAPNPALPKARPPRSSRSSEAVRLIGAEEFAATVGDACGYCAFKRICPAHDEGASILIEEKP